MVKHSCDNVLYVELNHHLNHIDNRVYAFFLFLLVIFFFINHCLLEEEKKEI